MAKAAAVTIDRPTDEQARHAIYQIRPVRTERGQMIGRAYARVPLFERLALREGFIGDRETEALRRYREAFDYIERSPTKCCLDVTLELRERTPKERTARQWARETVRACEAPLGMLVHTMRAVALRDVTYEQVALERYGTVRRRWGPVDKKGRTKGEHLEVIAASSRLVDQVRDEFEAGLKRLAAAMYS